MSRIFNIALLSAALIVPVAIAPTPLRADEHHDHKYQDKDHNDEHEWNNHEDRAYRMWVKENHRKYKNFEKLKEEERQQYWGWRHNHSDAELKIEIK